MKVKIGRYRPYYRWMPEWLQPKRTESVRIDPWDTWNMDTTLSMIILPMLKQLKETKHGYPFTDNEDVPEKFWTDNSEDDSEGFMDKRWDWIMDEMIFAFEEIDSSFDKEWSKEKDERIANGLKLFGKYFRALWD